MAWAFGVQLLAVRAFATGLLPDDGDAEVVPLCIDVNRASVAELQVLPSIGPTRAEQIVLERIRGGSFRDLDDLARVPGLGPHALAELDGFVQFR